jgi:hypothetical protein
LVVVPDVEFVAMLAAAGFSGEADEGEGREVRDFVAGRRGFTSVRTLEDDGIEVHRLGPTAAIPRLLLISRPFILRVATDPLLAGDP